MYTGTTTPVSGGAIPAPADAREDLQGDVSAASGEKDASEGSRRRAFRVADPCAGTSGSSSRGCDLPGTPSSPSELSGCGVADKAHTGFEPVFEPDAHSGRIGRRRDPSANRTIRRLVERLLDETEREART